MIAISVVTVSNYSEAVKLVHPNISKNLIKRGFDVEKQINSSKWL